MTTEAVRTEPPPLLIDAPPDGAGVLTNAIEDLYERRLDVAVVRRSWADAQLASVAASLDADGRDPGWNRPNAVMPPEDIQVLGTAATPTYSTPTGPTLDRYMEDAGWYDRAPLFDKVLDPTAAVARGLGAVAGGRPVEVLHAADGRRFSPFTVRRLTAGKGIGLHHDLHTSLEMFKDVAPGLDRRTLISYVFTLQGPDAGGELCVYNCPPDAPNPPKMPNGFSWDLAGVERRFGSVTIKTDTGDLFLFASARLLHRVAPVVGPRARFTLGGFLALDARRERVLFWS
ncbi:MAG TPA: 2OG-Fe(II) oxygenase [Vicinamibacterales bacterium]|jgi:hypothetical protein|nr:2OG-Fe(II) oxygenase [Vicinamibacterales bacterium]